MRNPTEDLGDVLADPALDADDAGRVVCVPCDVLLGPVAWVGLVAQRIREYLDE